MWNLVKIRDLSKLAFAGEIFMVSDGRLKRVRVSNPRVTAGGCCAVQLAAAAAQGTRINNTQETSEMILIIALSS